MPDSLFEKYNNKKTESFKSNKALDDLINELKYHLQPIQTTVESNLQDNKWPVSLIVGNPRSGTTLLTQWLASLNTFAVPTNLLARFSYAPYLGALIQNLLFNAEYDYQGDLKDIQPEINYNSNLGKSKGALATNEFFHFFRNYMPNFDPQYLDSKSLEKVDFNGMKKGFASIEKAFNKPFVAKGLMLQYNISELYNHIPNIIFIHLKRDPIYIMQSVYFARKKYYGDESIWWSVKPYEYFKLKDLDIYHQIAGQVYYTDLSIKKSLKKIPKTRQILVDYNDFCENPKGFYNILHAKYEELGYSINSSIKNFSSFTASKKIDLNIEEINKFKSAYKFFLNKNN